MLYKLSSLDACELSHQSPGCFHRPPAFVLVKMSRVLHRGMFFCKRGLFKKLAHLLYYFLCNVFYHYFSLSLMDFGPSVVRQGSPAAFRMHESLVTGCRGYSSQTVGLNICLWDDREKGHLWPSRRVITMVMHSSHIWEDVDGAVALRSASEGTKDGSCWFYMDQWMKHDIQVHKLYKAKCVKGIVRQFGWCASSLSINMELKTAAG